MKIFQIIILNYSSTEQHSLAVKPTPRSPDGQVAVAAAVSEPETDDDLMLGCAGAERGRGGLDRHG